MLINVTTLATACLRISGSSCDGKPSNGEESLCCPLQQRRRSGRAPVNPLARYSRGTHAVLTRYSLRTHCVLTRYRGTERVQLRANRTAFGRRQWKVCACRLVGWPNTGTTQGDHLSVLGSSYQRP